jgi:hypothetical protein
MYLAALVYYNLLDYYRLPKFMVILIRWEKMLQQSDASEEPKTKLLT